MYITKVLEFSFKAALAKKILLINFIYLVIGKAFAVVYKF